MQGYIGGPIKIKQNWEYFRFMYHMNFALFHCEISEVLLFSFEIFLVPHFFTTLYNWGDLENCHRSLSFSRTVTFSIII